MRSLVVAFTSLMLFTAGAAQAKIQITIDKDNQEMTVAVDGVERYHWPVSTGIPSRETPNGTYRAFRMEEDHFSKEFDDAPMPHSIFFTKIGHAIHGTDQVNRLGSPASHGCVRLSRGHASTLYALVERDGVLNTTVTLTGSAQVALARNPRLRNGNAMARRDYDPDAGDPVPLTPQARDDGYGGARANNRQVYDTQVYAAPSQQYYYGNRGYPPPAQGYYYQPRPYYQPRGYNY